MKRINLIMKLIITSIIAIVFMILISNKSYAKATVLNSDWGNFGIIKEGTLAENSLNNIPSVMTFDMQTTNLKNLEEVIIKEIGKVLNEQGIKLEYAQIWQDTNGFIQIFFNRKDQYISSAEIVLQYKNESETKGVRKEVSIQWTNKNTYSENDKLYVDNLIKNIGFSKNETGTYFGKFHNYFEIGSNGIDREKYWFLEEEIKDSSISLLITGGGASGDGYSMSYDIFRNSVYYEHCYVKCSNYIQVTVPNNIEDTETAYINYSLPKIKVGLNKEYEKQIDKINLEKQSGYYYKAYFTVDGQNKDLDIVIRKADGTPIGNNIYVDNLTQGANITATPIEKSSVMVTHINNAGYTNIIGSYELKLEGATSLTSPIDITFNVGTQYNNKKVYILHQKKNGTLENFEKTVSNGKVTITVSELSPFMIAVKESSSSGGSSNIGNTGTSTDTPNNDNNTGAATTPPPSTGTSNGNKLDVTPKTGEISIIGILSGIAGIMLVGIIVLKKKK